ncbi:hypothetical protein VTI28DRAFT_3573 [Corynascus sepedonium]
MLLSDKVSPFTSELSFQSRGFPPIRGLRSMPRSTLVCCLAAASNFFFDHITEILIFPCRIFHNRPPND